MYSRFERSGRVFGCKESSLYYGYSNSGAGKLNTLNQTQKTEIIQAIKCPSRSFLQYEEISPGTNGNYYGTKYGILKHTSGKYFIKEQDNLVGWQSNNPYNEIVSAYICTQLMSEINIKFSCDRFRIEIQEPLYGCININSGKGVSIYSYNPDIKIGNRENPVYVKHERRIDRLANEIEVYLREFNVFDSHTENMIVSEVGNKIHITLFDLISTMDTREFHEYLAHERYLAKSGSL